MSERASGQQAGGALIAVVWFLLFWLSFPGLDDVSVKYGSTVEERAEIRAKPLGRLELAAVDFNRSVRGPTLEPLNLLEWPLRVKLNFFLYPNGPSRMDIAEIRVDGVLVHRTNDPHHAWKAEQLAFRRLRPVVYSTIRDQKPQSWRGLLRWIGQCAETELGGSSIEVTTQRGPYPGTELHPVLVYRATAPDWLATRERLK